MLINLEQRKIKIKLVWNHFNLKFILNYSMYFRKRFLSKWDQKVKFVLYLVEPNNRSHYLFLKFVSSNLRFMPSYLCLQEWPRLGKKKFNVCFIRKLTHVWLFLVKLLPKVWRALPHICTSFLLVWNISDIFNFLNCVP